MEEPIIQVKNLKKTFKVAQREKSTLLSSIRSLFRPTYKMVDAIDGISFQINKGEIRGLIGPNGAGKSTTIKILSGILYPTSGEVSVMGYVPWKEREQYVSRIGAVFGQKSQLWWDLPPIDTYALQKEMYKIDNKVYQYNLAYFKELLRVSEIITRPTRQLSLGERMKCELICAMLHDPPLIYLDEPTIGLDLISKETIRNFIMQVKEEKKTTFILTTHDLADIENLCENITIINKGSSVYDGPLSSLKTSVPEFNKKILELHFSERVSQDQLKQYSLLEFDGLSATLEILPQKGAGIQDELKKVINNLPVEDINVNDLGIEEIIKQIYQEKSTSFCTLSRAEGIKPTGNEMLF